MLGSANPAIRLRLRAIRRNALIQYCAACPTSPVACPRRPVACRQSHNPCRMSSSPEASSPVASRITYVAVPCRRRISLVANETTQTCTTTLHSDTYRSHQCPAPLYIFHIDCAMYIVSKPRRSASWMRCSMRPHTPDLRSVRSQQQNKRCGRCLCC